MANSHFLLDKIEHIFYTILVLFRLSTPPIQSTAPKGTLVPFVFLFDFTPPFSVVLPREIREGQVASRHGHGSIPNDDHPLGHRCAPTRRLLFSRSPRPCQGLSRQILLSFIRAYSRPFAEKSPLIHSRIFACIRGLISSLPFVKFVSIRGETLQSSIRAYSRSPWPCQGHSRKKSPLLHL